MRVSTITEDQTPGRRVHDPKHPRADAQGYVTYSNVNAVEEMVNMISASRSYQNNVEVMNTAKSLLLKTLQLGQVMTSTPSITASRQRHSPRCPRSRTPQRRRDGDRFLKLLVAQIQNQDPLNPMDNAQVTSRSRRSTPSAASRS